MLSKSSLARSLALVRQSVDRLCHHRHVHITFSTLLILVPYDQVRVVSDWVVVYLVHSVLLFKWAASPDVEMCPSEVDLISLKVNSLTDAQTMASH